MAFYDDFQLSDIVQNVLDIHSLKGHKTRVRSHRAQQACYNIKSNTEIEKFETIKIYSDQKNNMNEKDIVR